MRYRPEIDGLRCVAIVPVLLFHAGASSLSGGFTGVDIFFVISGYLMTRQIVDGIDRGAFSFLDFYGRRARRILPALLVCLLASLVAGWFGSTPRGYTQLATTAVGAVFFVANIVLYQGSGYFETAANLNPLVHLWSLSVEEQFYLLLPLLLAFTARRARPALPAVLLVAAAVSFAAAVSTVEHDRYLAFYSLHTRAFELLTGAIVATISLIGPLRAVREAVGAVGLLLCAAGFFVIDEAAAHPGIVTLMPVLGSAAIIMCADDKTVVGRILSNRLLVSVGLISYSLYLVHQPVLAFARVAFGELSAPQAAALLALSGLLAYLSWYFVEMPYRRGVLTAPRVSLAGLSAATVLFASFAVVRADGAPSRMDPYALRILKQISDAANVGRGAETERCAIGRSGAAVTLDAWDCFPRADPKIIVYGDSHAADQAWGLWLAGVDVGQLTAGKCPLVYSREAVRCNQMLDKLLSLIDRGDVDGVLLVRRGFARYEEERDLTEAAAFWKNIGVPVLVISPQPEFNGLTNAILRRSFSSKYYDGIEPDWSFNEAASRRFSAFRNAGIPVVDSVSLFCGDRPHCSFIADGKTLMRDPNHLSRAGAEMKGRHLVKSAAWKRWIEEIGTRAGSRRSQLQ